jgi:hypothetical protein
MKLFREDESNPVFNDIYLVSETHLTFDTSNAFRICVNARWCILNTINFIL